ncbi:MAG: UDP-glycosyltransferase [Flavobacterium sp.]|nr:UDP-glycosyltransferase [Flavobacterium sp.]
MNTKKIFILLPDGIGLRNFAYSKFVPIGEELGFKSVFWNSTPFDLSSLGFNEIKINNPKTQWFTDVLKNARKHIELNLFIEKENDKTYNGYRFPFVSKNFKGFVKNTLTKLVIYFNSTPHGLEKIRDRIKKQERTTQYYTTCKETLKAEKPTIVFCTNQRPVIAIAPILAAQDLEIPTATFIFSWDNLPKATMVIETDYYFVWSELMKKQLLYYYPYINENLIFITGTPQFENHFDVNTIIPKDVFFKKYNLDLNKKYVCFSGDDITTSPDDPKYLEDFANAITTLNSQGHNLGIIFRKCPVDFSGRYNKVLNKFASTIVAIDPDWKNTNFAWDTILPTPNDVSLLSNIAFHSELVVNLGSSMVFDFVSFGKPCAYFNYNQSEMIDKLWSIHKCYKYIHFRSMPTKEAVVWLNNANEIATKIESLLQSNTAVVDEAKNWFKVINQHPPEHASMRIWDGIQKIIAQ